MCERERYHRDAQADAVEALQAAEIGIQERDRIIAQLREALREARSRYQARNDAYVEQVAEAERLRGALREIDNAVLEGDVEQALNILDDHFGREFMAALGDTPDE